MAIGDLWECIEPNGAVRIFESIHEILGDSKMFLTGTGKDNREIISLTNGDGPIRYLTITAKDANQKGLNFVSLVPLAYQSGSPHNLIVRNIIESEEGAEAVIEAESENGSQNLYIFDPLYFYDKEYLAIGTMRQFSLSVLINNTAATDNLEIEISEGPMIEIERNRRKELDPGFDTASITSVKISLDGMSAFLNTGESDFYEIRTKLNNINFYNFEDMQYFSSKCVFQADDDPFNLTLFGFLNERNPVFPGIGDNLQTIGFLQGHLIL